MGREADETDPAAIEPGHEPHTDILLPINGGRRRAVIRVCLSTLAGLLLGEIGLRAYLDIHYRRLHSAALREEKALPPGELGFSTLFTPSIDSGLVYGMIPGARGRFFGADLSINSSGYRAPEFPKSKSDGEIRVVLLGDSHGFGWRTAADETIDGRLRASIQALAGPSKKVESYNLSVPGYNLAQKARALERDGIPLRPDIVIAQVHLDDALPPWLFAERGFWRLDRLYLLRIAQIVADVALGGEKVLRGLDGSRFRDPVRGGPLAMDERDIPRRYRKLSGFGAMRRALERMRDACQECGAAFWVLLPADHILKGEPGADHDPEFDSIRSICAELGVEVIDPFPRTRGFALRYGLSDSDLIFPWIPDSHPSPARHALSAAALLPPVANRLALRAASSEEVATQVIELENRAREAINDVYLYAGEDWGGTPVRWMGKGAKLFVTPKSGRLAIPVWIANLDIESNPLRIRFELEGSAPIEVTRAERGIYRQTFTDCRATSESLMLEIEVDRTFKEGPGGRELGIALYPPE